MSGFPELSPRQREVLELICQGLTTQLISERLELSPNTVAEYRQQILRRVGAANVVELVNLVNEHRRKQVRSSLSSGFQNALNQPPDLIVVEDDANYRNIVVSSLLQQGFPCRGVESSADLESAVRVRLPSIVILDLNLGGEDGLEIANRLKSHRELGVIMMTTRGMVEQRIDGLAMGADAYLVKPVDMRVLCGVIRNLDHRLLEARFAGSP